MDLNEEKLEIIKKILSVSDTRVIEQIKSVLEMSKQQAKDQQQGQSGGHGQPAAISTQAYQPNEESKRKIVKKNAKMGQEQSGGKQGHQPPYALPASFSAQ